MQIIIDRFEGKFAVIELPDKRTWNVPKELFPHAVEGDVVDIIINKEATEKRQASIQDRFNRLKNNSK